MKIDKDKDIDIDIDIDIDKYTDIEITSDRRSSIKSVQDVLKLASRKFLRFPL